MEPYKYLNIEYDVFDEGVIDTLADLIDQLLYKIIELLKKLRKKISDFRSNKKYDNINSKIKDIILSDVGVKTLKYTIPNKDSIKLYIDVLYTNSYTNIIDKIMMMINNREDIKQIKFAIYGTPDKSDIYSENNDYVHIVREYASKTLKRTVNNRKDLNVALASAVTDNHNIIYTNATEIANELIYKKDFKRTRISKDIKQIDDIIDWTIDYYTTSINKSLAKVSQFRGKIKRNKELYDREILDMIYQVSRHYMRLLRDGDIFYAAKAMRDMQNNIYTILDNIVGNKE